MALIEAPVKLFAGRVRPLPGDSRTTGMFKTAIGGIAAIRRDGLVGDEQADRRVHGGAEKALHFYAAEHYPALAARFPEAAPQLLAGSIGENISAAGITEAMVRIGDTFALGSARVQVGQPRQPCWKIDARFGVDGMTAFIAERGLTGGYLRVIEEGVAENGDRLTLIDRDENAPTLAGLWRIWCEHRPDPDRLRAMAACPALNENWRRKLFERIAWLEAQRS